MWCLVWHIRVGNFDAAHLVMELPPEAFAFGDALMRAAYVAGAQGALNDPQDSTTETSGGVDR